MCYLSLFRLIQVKKCCIIEDCVPLRGTQDNAITARIVTGATLGFEVCLPVCDTRTVCACACVCLCVCVCVYVCAGESLCNA